MTPPGQCAEGAITALREAGYAVPEVAVDHAEWTPHVYLHIVLPEAAVVSRPVAVRARGQVLARRASASGDGALPAGGGLRPGDATARGADPMP